jgi:hypothetical protein
MKTFCISLLLLIAFSSINAQEQIKKIIFEDLLFLNDLYNGCILQYEQNKIIIKGRDTISDFNTIETIRSNFNRVTIIEIDSINSFYFVEVRFDLNANPRYLELFSNNTFSYVFYKSEGNYYKINGFFISEILMANIEPDLLRDIARKEVPKKLYKYIQNRNIEKIRKHLTVSVLKKIDQLGFQFNYRPYVKDIVCY